MSACLSHLCAALGDAHPVGILQDDPHTVDPSIIAMLQARGLREFRVDTRSTPELCMSAMQQTLNAAGLSPADIGAIVIGHSTSSWDLEQELHLLRLLGSAGFERVRLVGIALQQCAAAAQVLQAAKDMVLRGQARRVLVVVFGRLAEGTRVAPGAATVFSDGAVSCLVSGDGSGFEIVSTDTMTVPSLAHVEWGAGNARQYFDVGTGLVKDVAASVCAQAGISADRIAMVFGTNSNVFCLQMTGLAVGVGSAQVHQGNLAGHAHVFGCDAMLGLKSHCDASALAAGSYALLVGWAPYVASACLVRRV
jgi:3-oxoacyl-[acyl-carrier-protein] synthase III